MNVIWAHGQRQGNYTFNVMPSGVNVQGASDKDFYKDDELKYHGFTQNRGTMSVDFNSRSIPGMFYACWHNGQDHFSLLCCSSSCRLFMKPSCVSPL